MLMLKNTFLIFCFLIPVSVMADDECRSSSIKTNDILTCLHVSLSIIDNMLNDRYDVVLRREGFPYKSALKEVEGLWEIYRDSKCNYIYESIDPGREAVVEKESCMLSVTYARLLELIYIESSVRDTSLERFLAKSEERSKYDLIRVEAMDASESAYFMKNCELVEVLYGEAKESCIKRMWVQNL